MARHPSSTPPEMTAPTLEDEMDENVSEVWVPVEDVWTASLLMHLAWVGKLSPVVGDNTI